jgi:tetratricopeptide (TPR) repeat protein
MNPLLLALLFQTMPLPARSSLENPIVITQAPKQIKADYDKTWARFISGKDDAAVEREIEKLLKKQKDFAPALVVQAYQDLYLARNREAQLKLEKVLSQNPSHRIALFYLAELAYLRRAFQPASELYSRLLAVDNSRPDLEIKRQKALLLATETFIRNATREEESGRLAEAESLYREALQLAPLDSTLQRRLGLLLMKQQKWEEALSVFSRQLESNQAANRFDDEPPRYIVEILTTLGRSTEAQEARERLAASGSSGGGEVDLGKVSDLSDLEDLGRWGLEIERFRDLEAANVINREQLSAMIVRYFPQVSDLGGDARIVTDIQDSWAQSEIQTVLNAAILDPLPNRRFGPSQTVTRGDLAVALSRVARLLGGIAGSGPPIPAPDLAPSHASYGEVQLVLQSGLLSLDEAGNFGIKEHVSGKQAVSAAARLLGLIAK